MCRNKCNWFHAYELFMNVQFMNEKRVNAQNKKLELNLENFGAEKFLDI